MRTALGFSFFDSVKEIPLSLGDPDDPFAICNNVDIIIAVDGRYLGFDANHNYSEDGSAEYIKEHYENAVVEQYWGYQTDKRQRCFDLAGEMKCTHLIVLDSDEFLHPDNKYRDWIKFYENLYRLQRKYMAYHIFSMNLFIEQDYRKAFNVNQRGRFKSYPRIHVDPGNQRYALQCHYRWCHKDTTDAELVNREHLEFFGCPYVVKGVALTTNSKQRHGNTLTWRDKWAWDTMHEEKWRLATIRDKYLFGHGNLIDPDMKEFRSYDKKGRVIKSEEKTISLIP